MYINHNGNITSRDTKLFDVQNRSFRYGDGVFETMRVIDGLLMWSDVHAKRLQKGMQTLKMTNWRKFDANYLQYTAESLCRSNKISNNAMIRLAVYRGGLGTYMPESLDGEFVMEALPLEQKVYATGDKGLIIDVFNEVPKHADALANLKSNNSLVYVLAGIFKKQKAVDEVFLVNQSGFLCEGGSSNIFLRYQDVIYTPALSEGCVAGVMREVVLNLLKQHQVPVKEARIDIRILDAADEIFITNAVKGIQWVMGYGGKRFYKRDTPKFVEYLNQEAFRQLAIWKANGL